MSKESRFNTSHSFAATGRIVAGSSRRFA
jgi:hypothetical protein